MGRPGGARRFPPNGAARRSPQGASTLGRPGGAHTAAGHRAAGGRMMCEGAQTTRWTGINLTSEIQELAIEASDCPYRATL